MRKPSTKLGFSYHIINHHNISKVQTMAIMHMLEDLIIFKTKQFGFCLVLSVNQDKSISVDTTTPMNIPCENNFKEWKKIGFLPLSYKNYSIVLMIRFDNPWSFRGAQLLLDWSLALMIRNQVQVVTIRIIWTSVDLVPKLLGLGHMPF